VYDSTGSAHQEIWAPSTSGARGYAHPIDGWAKSSPVLGCPTKSTTTKSSTSKANPKTSSQSTKPKSGKSKGKGKGKKKSPGAIAGIVIGALSALAAILGFILVLLKRKKEAKEDTDAAKQLMGDDGKPAPSWGGADLSERHWQYARWDTWYSRRLWDSSKQGTVRAHESGVERVSELPAKI
jgi:hypothetical protein